MSVRGWLAASGSLSLITDITTSSTSDPEQVTGTAGTLRKNIIHVGTEPCTCIYVYMYTYLLAATAVWEYKFPTLSSTFLEYRHGNYS